MSHSLNKIWIHAIWSTKDREPLIKPGIDAILHEFINSQLKELGCSVQAINSMADHIHCLFLLNPQKPITEIIKQIKGSSSHHINQQNLLPGKFAWQTGYAAYSVSESVIDKVIDYIRNQKEHHQKRTFENEFDEFAKLHRLEL